MPASAAKHPDLLVKAVSGEQSVPAGAIFTVRDKTANVGEATSGRSMTRFYLSADAKLSAHDIRVSGGHRVAVLGPRRASARSSNVLVPRPTPPGTYRLLACADDKRSVRESNERNNCRASSQAVTVGPVPSTDELIERAVRRKELPRERGIVYRMFSAFGDRRLPSVYSGNDGHVTDSEAPLDAARHWQALSRQSRRSIAPYLIPPFYKGSWASSKAAQARAASLTTRSNPGSACLVPEPAFDTVGNDHVQVWYHASSPADAAEAQAIADEVDTTIWSSVSSVMGAPHGDEGTTVDCRGGDGRIDIVLLPGVKRKAQAIPYEVNAQGLSACPAKGFILVDDGLSHDLTMAAVAHELFHIVQFDYSEQACAAGEWLHESTAAWINDFVYPDTQTEHDYVSDFMPAPFLGYDSLFRQSVYGSYLFWFDLTRRGMTPQQVIKGTFDNLAFEGRAAAIKDAVGDLNDAFRRFAVDFWDSPPADDFKQWDALDTHPTQIQSVNLDPDDPTAAQIGQSNASSDTGLSASYREFTFSNDARDVKISPVKPGGAVQILYEVGGTWRGPETVTSEREFCRKKTGENVTDLVVIYTTDSPGGSDGVGGDLTVAHDCDLKLTGTVTYTDQHDDTTSSIGTGEHHFTKTVKLDLHLLQDPDTHDWADDGSSGKLTGSGSGFDAAGSGENYCRTDATWTYSGSDPLGPVTFAVFPGPPETAILSVAWTGKQSYTDTASGPRCASGHDDYPEEASVSCSDGKVTRDAKGRLTVDFDTTETTNNDTSQTGGTSTDTITCKGTLVEPQP